MAELKELQLALLLAGATCIGVFGGALLDNVMLDASTSRETDVQIVQLAIGVLSKEIDQTDEANSNKDRALRTWAVDSLNAVSKVKLVGEARTALIDGNSSFDSVATSLEIIRRRMQEVESRAPTIFRQGSDRILIEIPGVASVDEMKAIIGETGELTFSPAPVISQDE